MGLAGFRAKNHPQQTAMFGPDDSIDNRGTLPEWFAELHERFAFTVDVAASSENAKVSRFFDRRDDGLLQCWGGERVWCNPPFSSLGSWVRKAWIEHRRSDLIVMLVPANRTEQGWWQDYIEPFRDRPGSALTTEHIRHRRRFIRYGLSEVLPNDRPPFGVCLLIWQHRAPLLPHRADCDLDQDCSCDAGTSRGPMEAGDHTPRTVQPPDEVRAVHDPSAESTR